MRMVLLALMSMLLVCGCGDEPQKSANSTKVVPKPPATKKTVAAPSEQPSEPVEEEKTTGFTYNPQNGRDPFESLLDIKVPMKAPESVPETPLQKYDLAQLHLVGVIVRQDDSRAMIIAPDGKSYILYKGIKVGKNNGIVIDINSDGVFVEELYYDFAGEVRKNVESIELPKRGGVE